MLGWGSSLHHHPWQPQPQSYQVSPPPAPLTADEDLPGGLGVLVLHLHLDGGPEVGVLALDLGQELQPVLLASLLRLLCKTAGGGGGRSWCVTWTSCGRGGGRRPPSPARCIACGCGRATTLGISCRPARVHSSVKSCSRMPVHWYSSGGGGERETGEWAWPRESVARGSRALPPPPHPRRARPSWQRGAPPPPAPPPCPCSCRPSSPWPRRTPRSHVQDGGGDEPRPSDASRVAWQRRKDGRQAAQAGSLTSALRKRALQSPAPATERPVRLRGGGAGRRPRRRLARRRGRAPSVGVAYQGGGGGRRRATGVEPQQQQQRHGRPPRRARPGPGAAARQ